MVSDNINTAVHKQIKNAVKREDTSKIEFDGNAIAQILARKVELVDFERISDLKANKTEFENLMDTISVIN